MLASGGACQADAPILVLHVSHHLFKHGTCHVHRSQAPAIFTSGLARPWVESAAAVQLAAWTGHERVRGYDDPNSSQLAMQDIFHLHARLEPTGMLRWDGVQMIDGDQPELPRQNLAKVYMQHACANHFPVMMKA